MKTKNQNGFTAIEGILLVLLLAGIGAAGYFAYQARQNKPSYSAAQVTQKPKTNTQVSTASDVSEKDQIIAAVKASGTADGNGNVSYPTQVTVKDIAGDNAQGSASAGESGSGYGWIAHHSNSKWTVVYKGQQAPGKDIGQQYNLPSDWYSSDY